MKYCNFCLKGNAINKYTFRINKSIIVKMDLYKETDLMLKANIAALIPNNFKIFTGF